MIICQMDMFSYDHSIYIYDEDNKTTSSIRVNSDDCITNLLEACKQYNQNDIRLIGPTKYCMQIAEEINTIAITKYALTNLTIEVN